MSALAKAVAKASRTAVTQAASKLIVPTLTSIQVRHGGALPHSHYISREHAELQVMKLLKNYPKIPQDKLTTNAHFMNDLGLDSLDCVEVSSLPSLGHLHFSSILRLTTGLFVTMTV